MEQRYFVFDQPGRAVRWIVVYLAGQPEPGQYPITVQHQVGFGFCWRCNRRDRNGLQLPRRIRWIHNLRHNDVVTEGGSTYVALVTNSGIDPATNSAAGTNGVGTVWALMAQLGATGSTGATGVAGPNGATGATGPSGADGVNGAAGATGATGATGLNWQSAPWSSGTTYNLDDAVFYNGSSYVSLQGSNTGNEPDTSASFWSLLAQQGATGATGTAGSNGAAGATGATGATGPSGADGVNGAAGATGATGATGAGLNWQSAPWSSGTTYNLNDAVFYNGSSYVSLQGSNTGNEPDTSASFWSLLAQQGATGATGAAGSNGAACNRRDRCHRTERCRRSQRSCGCNWRHRCDWPQLAVCSLVLRYHLQPERRRVLQRFVLRLAAGFQHRQRAGHLGLLLVAVGATRRHWRNRSRGFKRSRGCNRRDRCNGTERCRRSQRSCGCNWRHRCDWPQLAVCSLVLRCHL